MIYVYIYYRKVFLYNGMKFFIKDCDNDNFCINCVEVYYGGFWYNGCWVVNLNGVYYYIFDYNSIVCILVFNCFKLGLFLLK